MANYLFSEARLPGNVETLSLVILHQEVTLSQGQFNGYRIVRIVHYKEKTAIGHEFHALHLRKHDDPSRVIVLRIERRPSTRILTSSSTVTDDSISPMDPNFDYTQVYDISTTYCSEERPLTVLGLCEVCAFIRQASPVYSVWKAEHCYWFCAAFLIRLRMLDYCTGLTQRGPEYQRRGRCRGFKLISEDLIERKLTASAVNYPPHGLIPMPSPFAVHSDSPTSALALSTVLVNQSRTAAVTNGSPSAAASTPPLPTVLAEDLTTAPSLNTAVADNSQSAPLASKLPPDEPNRSYVSFVSTPSPSTTLADNTTSVAPITTAIADQWSTMPTAYSSLYTAAMGDLSNDPTRATSPALASISHSHASIAVRSGPTQIFRAAPESAAITTRSQNVFIPVSSHEVNDSFLVQNAGGLPSISPTSGSRLKHGSVDWARSYDCLGHPMLVYSVAFSPGGRHIISGSKDCTVCIWDATSGKLVLPPLKGHSNEVNSIAVSPDGRRIASASDDKSVYLWDLETGVPVIEPLMGHTLWVQSVAFSPDGRKIVSGSDDRSVRIWDVETGTAVGEAMRGHSGWVCSVAWSPDGSRIVSCSSDDTIRVWDAQTGTPLGDPLRGHTYVRSVAFSPDGSRVVSGSGDETVRLWDIASQRALGDPLRGHTEAVWSVAFSPDGRWIASGSSDKTVRIWDSTSGGAAGEVARLEAGSYVYSVAWSPAGDRVAAGCLDGKIRTWQRVPAVLEFVGRRPELARRA